MHYALNIGLDPKIVGTSGVPQTAFPAVEPRDVEAGIAAAREELAEVGLDLDSCFISDLDDVVGPLRRTLQGRRYVVAVIGAGVRLEPALTPVLELLVNVIRTHSPETTICFNTGPGSTAAAIRRWWPHGPS